MDTSYSDNIARLRAAFAAGDPVPVDLGRWALDRLTFTLPPSERVYGRNVYLRMAARLMGAKTIENKVQSIRRDVMALRSSCHRDQPADTSTPRGCVQAALQLDAGMPISAMQLRRIITTSVLSC